MRLLYCEECTDLKDEVYAIGPEDVGKPLHIRATVVDGEAVLEVWLDGVELGGMEPAPEPETWERLLVDLAEDTREGMVDIVAESTLHGLVNTLWGLEARKRLALALVEASYEAV